MKKAQIAFEKLAPSIKKMHYHMILRAKLPETKQKRINDILDDFKTKMV